jgi:thiamine biosynthesis lipoprotein ApbE
MRLHPTRLAIVFFLCGGLAWFVIASRHDAPSHVASEFYYHHDHILGTSLDLWITSSDEAGADTAEKAILDEIERLRRIFSTYDDTSEISRLNRTRAAMPVSADMIEVLRLYETFQQRSKGAFNGQLGELVRVWKEAESAQREPDAAVLSRIVHQIREPGWRIDFANGTVTRLTDHPLNLNAIAKGYIIQKAAAAARLAAPLSGLLVNLGGDMAVVGNEVVGVQDPLHPQDNAEPVTLVRLTNRAIATSGGYERYYTINGKRHSHLFDPRTGRSAGGPASATVIAPDNVTANALATTLCVLTPAEGLELVAATPGVECLLIGADGTQWRSAGFTALETPQLPVQAPAPDQVKKESDWPDQFQATISLSIPSVSAKKYRKPYVAVWVENADAKPVRTITVWGNNPRWIKDLPQWWKFAKNDAALVKAVSRATRSPGKYSLVWDGKDDKGNPLSQGTYTIYVEVHREHGKLVRQTGKLTCAAEPVQLTLEKNAETGDTIIEYGKKKQ